MHWREVHASASVHVVFSAADVFHGLCSDFCGENDNDQSQACKKSGIEEKTLHVQSMHFL
jgi:hypothetical protein